MAMREKEIVGRGQRMGDQEEYIQLLDATDASIDNNIRITLKRIAPYTRQHSVG